MTDNAWRPSEEFLRSIDIHTLLPQQEPFVMIGRLVAFNETTIATETVVANDNVFVAGGRFEAAGLVENIAQTCAARIGYINKYILKKGIQIGYIGSIRNLHIAAAPAVGQTITTTVMIREEVFGVILADATVTLNGDTIAETQIKIAIEKGEGEE